MFHKGGYHFPCRKGRIVQAQRVAVLYRKTDSGESAFQNFCCLSGIGKRKQDISAAFLRQLCKAFFFQQYAVVDDSNIVGKQGNLRKDMAGNENVKRDRV